MASFTLDQKKAHDPRRHISITANAGSGKTRVLVGRYCDLVERFGAMPEKIAAITFTEKAASELREKIAAEFDRRLADEEHRASWGRLKRARERFPSAIVSTIHGFCSQLLREFPIEIGVPPNFGVTSGYERRQLLDDALMDAIESALNVGNEDFEQWYDLARRVGRERMEGILRMMLDKREMVDFGRRSGALALGREQTVGAWMAAVDRALRAALLNAETRGAIETLAGLMKPENAADALSALAELRNARSPEEFIPRANDLRALLLTNDGKPRKRSYPLKADEFIVTEPHAATVGAAFRRCARLLESSGDHGLHFELFDDTQRLFALFDDVLRRYDERKRRQNVLDFEDLQLRLLDALDSRAFQEKARERFDHVMIDEFQDTNEMQYAVARRLLSGLETGRLCIVGDTKQSIYGFRNADVEVFAAASREIAEGNRRLERTGRPLLFRDEEIAPASTDEDDGVIKLSASFRLLPSICAFVNTACEPIIAGSGAGITYEALVCARRSDGRGAVEFLLAHPPADPDADPAIGAAAEDAAAENAAAENAGLQPRGSTADANEPAAEEPIAEEPIAEEPIAEEELIARRIAHLVRGGEPAVWEAEGGAPEAARPARYGDIAILCRKRSLFPAIEAALRAHGIPFATHGGAGFYRTQEIYDMLSYLRALLNPRDDIAHLGAFRSPFFAVSDAEIYRLTLTAGPSGRNLFARALHRVRSGKASEPLQRAVAAIEDDRAMAGRIPVALLLKRAIERTGWRGAVIGAERGEQNLANVEKLLEMAREYEARGFTNLFDFTERIGEMVEMEEMEGEAPLNTGRDAVALMTMHAAKGLEYPVVMLPSLHAPTRTSSEPFFDKDLGFGWNWRFNHQDYRPAVTALMGMRALAREGAEEARLFYVAATRARDMLIVCGEHAPERPSRNTMLTWALAPLGELPEDGGAVTLATPELRFLEDGITERPMEWTQTVRILRTMPPPPPPEEQSAPVPFRSGALRIGELPTRAEGEIYSATQFMVYSQCPTKYYLKYRLGIPEELSEAYGERDTDTEDGALFARLFRTMMAGIDRAIDPATRTLLRDENGAPMGLNALVRDALAMEPLAAANREAMRARLLDTAERIFESDAARAVIVPANAEARTDYRLTLPFGKEFVMGQMDRALFGEDGAIDAVQFKTRRLPREAVPAAAEAALPQLRVYAYLLKALGGRASAITCTVLFTEHPDIPQTFSFSTFETTRIEEELASGIADIRALSYSGRRELPLETPHCPACAYWVEGRCLLSDA